MADPVVLNGAARADNHSPLAALATVEAAAERWLTPNDIANKLKLSRSFVYGEIKRGRLHASLFGRLPRVRESDFAAYLAAAEEARAR